MSGAPVPGSELVALSMSPRLAGHLAVAIYDHRKRCAASGQSAPAAELDALVKLFRELSRVMPGHAGSAIDLPADPADAAPVSPRLLDVDQTAAVLSVSPSTVKRLISRGELPAVSVGPGNRRVRVSDLDDFVAGLPVRDVPSTDLRESA